MRSKKNRHARKRLQAHFRSRAHVLNNWVERQLLGKLLTTAELTELFDEQFVIDLGLRVAAEGSASYYWSIIRACQRISEAELEAQWCLAAMEYATARPAPEGLTQFVSDSVHYLILNMYANTPGPIQW
jgi:hypothetical protein